MMEVIAPFGSTVAVLISQFVMRQKAQKMTGQLVAQLPAADKARLVKGAVHATRGELGYRIRLHDPSTATISAVCDDLGRIRLSPRRLLDRWGAQLFPHAAFQSGDPAFDERVLVQTRDPVVARKWLGNAAVRRLALGSQPRKPSALHLDADRLKLCVCASTLAGDAGPALLDATLDKLGAMTASLDELSTQHLPLPAPRRDDALKASWWITGVSCVLGLAIFIASAAYLSDHGGMFRSLPELLLGGLASALVPVLGTLALSRLLAARSAPWRVLWIQGPLLFLAGLGLAPLLGRLLGELAGLAPGT